MNIYCLEEFMQKIGDTIMSLKLLLAFLRKKLIVFTPEEFAEMMRPYEFTMKVAQNLGKLESELHMSDDADQIIKRALKEACDFYGADWAGFLDVDMVMKVWSPHHWYNTHSRDQTKELTNTKPDKPKNFGRSSLLFGAQAFSLLFEGTTPHRTI